VSYLEVVHAQAIWKSVPTGDLCAPGRAGKRMGMISEEGGVPPGTLYLWKRQALEAGMKPGTKSIESTNWPRRASPLSSSRQKWRP
jgi:hypothetical protein